MIDNESINYLAATLVGEARGEPIEGQIAVANVIRNRVRVSGGGYKAVCLEPKQFSCWNNDDSNSKLVRNFLSRLESGDDIHEPIFRQCLAIARSIVAEDFLDNTQGCRNYVTLSRYQLAKARAANTDLWMLRLKPVVTIGQHIFLSEKESVLKEV